MRFNLNVSEDAELRKEVLNLVKGQIEGFVKNEIKDLVTVSLTKNGENLSSEKLTKLVNSSIDGRVASFVGANSFGSEKNRQLRVLVIERINLILEEMKPSIAEIMERLIRETVSTNLQVLVSEMVKAEVKNTLKNILGKE